MTVPRGLVTRVILVRHGETEWNVRGRVQGRADVPLTTRGETEAQALREQLSDYPINAAVASPLARARATAVRIVAGRQPRPIVEPGFAEVDYGIWQGTTAAERRRADPRRSRGWETTPAATTFVGGESFAHFRRRVLAAWHQVIRTYRGSTVLVVAHGHVNRIILLNAFELPSDQFWQIEQSNGAVTMIEVAQRGADS